MTNILKEFKKDRYKAIYKVGSEYQGMRLDHFAIKQLSGISREKIKEKIKSGEIAITSRNSSLKPNNKIHLNDEIQIIFNKTVHEDEYWNGKKINTDIRPLVIFEDKDLLIISKPPYMSTHPTGRHLFNCATVFFREKLNKKVHSIHRLDRETSGALILSKNSMASTKYTKMFEDNLVKKAYFFISKKTSNFNLKDNFQVNRRLSYGKKGTNRVYIESYDKNSDKGKPALTRFKIVEEKKGYVLGLAFPITGRQHQIRVHAASCSIPILGDKLYMGSFKLFQKFKDNLATNEDYNFMELPRHALHAMGIYFNNKLFLAPISEDLVNFIKNKLKVDAQNLQKKLKTEIENYINNSER